MAKKPNPWYWEARNVWCVKIDGERQLLGEHPADLPPPQKSKKTGRWNTPQPILDAFHRLMRGESLQPVAKDRSPIKGMKKPKAQRRSDVVAPGELEEMLALSGIEKMRLQAA